MTVQGTPALVARSGQTVIDAFIRNSSGQIEETWYNWGNGQWGGWITVDGGSFSSDPSAVATADGHDQVFATRQWHPGYELVRPWQRPDRRGSSAGGMTVQGTPALWRARARLLSTPSSATPLARSRRPGTTGVTGSGAAG